MTIPSIININGEQYQRVGSSNLQVTLEMWEAVEKAEQRLYRDDMGCHGYTDVMHYDHNDTYLGEIWANCQLSVENTDPNYSTYSAHAEKVVVAKRVAAALAVIAFGPEFLLK